MKPKTIIAITFVTVSAIAGIYVATINSDNQIHKQKVVENTSKIEPKNKVTIPPVVPVKSYYTKSEYWNTINKKSRLSALYNKSHSIFKESKNAEDIATWISMGLVMSSKDEYGKLLNHSMNEINKNAEDNFNILADKIKTLSSSDSFLRGQLLNLAAQVNVDREQKVALFGDEASRELVLNENGRMTSDALNITTAMIFLKSSISSEDQAREYIYKSIELNNDAAARKKLITRFSSYFPSFANELSNHQ